MILGWSVVAGCSARMHGTEHELPARPALGAPIDRAGRPLTGNALLGPLAVDGSSDRRKEAYNRAAQADWPAFVPDIQRTLGLYDGFDGACGNQWLAARAATATRYHTLAAVLADDRLWIASASTVCTRSFAVELAALAPPSGPIDATADAATDATAACGGRTPDADVTDAFRSLLVLGRVTGVDDGIARDDHAVSTTVFPFLAAP